VRDKEIEIANANNYFESLALSQSSKIRVGVGERIMIS
jgi:hypothetical protein